MLGLVCTSLGFMVPAMIALHRRKNGMAKACILLTATSTIFHSTYHPLAKLIDMSYVYCLSTYYVSKGIHYLLRYKRKKDFYIHIGSLGCVFLYFNRCSKSHLPHKERRQFHMLFHLTAQVLLTVHALDKNILIE